MRRYTVAIVLILILFAAGYGIGNLIGGRGTHDVGTPSPAGGARVQPPRQVSDFTLTSDTGEPVSLSDFRGEAVLFFFGYTHCPDVCPNTLANFTRVKEALGETADDVTFAFISVDGERDSPDVIADYLAQFDSEFVGMTGSAEQLREIGREYSLQVGRETINVDHEHTEGDEHDLDEENYFVQHTSPAFLLDPEGYLRRLYFYGTGPDIIAAGIREMLSRS